MSDKIRNALNKPFLKQKAEQIMQEESNIPNNILTESVKVNKYDKEAIYSFIEQPGNHSFILKTYSDSHDDRDRTIIISRKSGNMVLITYLSEFAEITDFLITLCDEMGYVFTSREQKNNDITAFEIFVR